MADDRLDHQWVSDELYLMFCAAVPRGRRVVQDCDVIVFDEIRKPDVVVLRAESEVRPVPGQMVQAVVEIISPSEDVDRTGYAVQGIPLYVVVKGMPRNHFAEIYRLAGDAYELYETLPAHAWMEFGEPFPFILDMKQINT
jgi:Uma2 family endonuclease